MKFGIFYEHQLPRPWGEGAELQLFQDALDQVELVAQLGQGPQGDHRIVVRGRALDEARNALRF